jgi:hypothetical protein
MLLIKAEMSRKLKEALERLRVDEATFFRLAHIYCFGSDPDLTSDVLRFKETGVVPQYVIRYLNEGV